MSAPQSSSSNNAANQSNNASEQNQQPENASLPQLSALEDDDEFEEFEAEDWQDEAGEPKGTSTVLWQDNWDEADLEDSFSEQLRTALKNPNAGQSGAQPMQS